MALSCLYGTLNKRPVDVAVVEESAQAPTLPQVRFL